MANKIKQSLAWWCFGRSLTPDALIAQAKRICYAGVEMVPQEHWHQDRWNYLDHDPLLTTWTALDPATRANGCVQVIPGSHKFGLINPDHPSGFLNVEQAARFASTNEIVYLELEAGEAVLLHNWLLHRSDTNTTAIPRRAFSVCYLNARTRASNGETCYSLF